jgi:hypothetical protein
MFFVVVDSSLCVIPTGLCCRPVFVWTVTLDLLRIAPAAARGSALAIRPFNTLFEVSYSIQY